MDKSTKTLAAAGIGAAAVVVAPVVVPVAASGAVVGAVGAIIASVYSALSSAQDEVKTAESKVAQSGDASTLEQTIKKQQLLVDFQLSMSRVAQEVAIASRISHSKDVEIEEFYDRTNALAGEMGASIADRGIKLGGSSDSKSVVKRIYKFNGLPSDAP